MIHSISKNKYNIAEFMVIPKYRRKNIGKETAFKCFDMFKGYWQVTPSLGSKQAYVFWKHVIDLYTNNNNEFRDGTFLFKNL